MSDDAEASSRGRGRLFDGHDDAELAPRRKRADSVFARTHNAKTHHDNGLARALSEPGTSPETYDGSSLPDDDESVLSALSEFTEDAIFALAFHPDAEMDAGLHVGPGLVPGLVYGLDQIDAPSPPSPLAASSNFCGLPPSDRYSNLPRARAMYRERDSRGREPNEGLRTETLAHSKHSGRTTGSRVPQRSESERDRDFDRRLKRRLRKKSGRSTAATADSRRRRRRAAASESGSASNSGRRRRTGRIKSLPARPPFAVNWRPTFLCC